MREEHILTAPQATPSLLSECSLDCIPVANVGSCPRSSYEGWCASAEWVKKAGLYSSHNTYEMEYSPGLARTFISIHSKGTAKEGKRQMSFPKALFPKI